MSRLNSSYTSAAAAGLRGTRAPDSRLRTSAGTGRHTGRSRTVRRYSSISSTMRWASRRSSSPPGAPARAASVTPCQMRAINLEPVELGDGAFIPNISRVEGRIGLEQQDVRFFLRDRQVLDAVRNDDELARLDHEVLVSQLHPQPALHDQEQLILALMMVPDELALELRELHQVVVHSADDLGTPVILKPAEHLGEIDFANGGRACHDTRSSTALVSSTVENSPFRSASATSCSSSDA